MSKDDEPRPHARHLPREIRASGAVEVARVEVQARRAVGDDDVGVRWDFVAPDVVVAGVLEGGDPGFRGPGPAGDAELSFSCSWVIVGVVDASRRCGFGGVGGSGGEGQFDGGVLEVVDGAPVEVVEGLCVAAFVAGVFGEEGFVEGDVVVSGDDKLVAVGLGGQPR